MTDKTPTRFLLAQLQATKEFTPHGMSPSEDFWYVRGDSPQKSGRPKSPISRPPRCNPFALLLLLLVSLDSTAGQAAEPTKPALGQLTSEQAASGWINLFDGETLFGWTPTSDANWKVEDGAITVSEGEQGFLMTNAEFADYQLHVEIQGRAGTNSGVFLQSALSPSDPTKDCYEVNFAPKDNPFPTGSLVGRAKHPQLAKSHLISAGSDMPADVLDILVHGDTIVVGMNGAGLRYRAPNPLLRGHIGLQFREGPVAFRNIRLKPLGLKPMLNGKDLAGWNTDLTQKSKFEVTSDGDLKVTGGNGQLETEASYGDFAMQLDCRVDGDNLNSGVFYRCIPRQYLNGYEVQIHNGVKDGDPTKPADFGTGGIYRRVPARRVVSKDHEWFTMTLVPTGAHVAVWVNGYQVTDWTDDRPPHDNPRNGLRTKPGTIAIQGHDPTTNLRFRDLRIAELPENDQMMNDE